MSKKQEAKQVWTPYRVTWTFLGNLFGSVPQSEGVIEPWIKSRQPKVKPPDGRSMVDIQEEVVSTLLQEPETTEEQMAKVSVGFQYLDNQEIHVRGATIRAHLKDCSRYVGKVMVGKVQGEYSLGWKFTNGCYIKEYWIPVKRVDGAPVTKPDGTREIFVHTMSRTGPINAVKNADFVSNVKLEFTMLLTPNVKLDDVKTVMTYGSIHGYAGERSMQEGQYEWEIEALSR